MKRNNLKDNNEEDDIEEEDMEIVDNNPSSSSSSSLSSSSLVVNDLPWIEKYRPKSLSELIAHEDIINILNKLIESNKLPHLLFHGPPGTGKTSTIIACAKKMFGDKYQSMVLELNASDDRGINVVRDQIKEFAGTKKLFSSGVKLIILDEADAMTSDAQAALRRVIEKYTSNTRFCLICNYVNKITPALQSRCTRFRFAPLQPEQISSRLEEVIQAEGVNITSSGKNAILQLAGGDLRRVLNLLQSSHLAFRHIDEREVYLTAGAVLPETIQSILNILLNSSFNDCYNSISTIVKENGYALNDIVTELSILVSKLDLPDAVIGHIIDKLSTIEYRLSHGVVDKIQIGALVGAFIVARNMMQ